MGGAVDNGGVGGRECYSGVVFIVAVVIVSGGSGQWGFIDFYERCRIDVYSSSSGEPDGNNEHSRCGKHCDVLEQSDDRAEQQCGGRRGGQDAGCAAGHAGHGVEERCRQRIGIDRLVDCGHRVVLAGPMEAIYEKHDMSAAFRLCNEFLDMQR